MKISNTRKEIINLISDYMDKTLSEGCLVNIHKGECKVIQFTGSNLKVWSYTNNRYINYKYPYHIGELDNKDNFEIVGHYDITAVLKYIIKNRKEDDVDISIGIEYIEMDAYDSEGSILIQIPNKTLHLYTEEEDKQLLDLLLKLK